MSIHFPAKIFNCYLTPCKNAGNFLVSIYVLEKIMEIYYVHLLPCKKAVKSLFYCKMLYIYYVYLLPCKNAEHFLMSVIFSMAIYEWRHWLMSYTTSAMSLSVFRKLLNNRYYPFFVKLSLSLSLSAATQNSFFFTDTNFDEQRVP